MTTRNILIDYEEYKIKVKISASTNFLIQQDMDRFGFFRTNKKKLNINSFINYILPIMYKYRQNKDNKLEKEISNNLIKNCNINEFIDKLNKLYYDDISYHEETINLRISKSNIELFDKIFSNTKIKKSTYIRTLINQYSSFKLDEREFLCFNKEYHEIDKALDKNIVNISTREGEFNILPIEIITCPITSNIYVFGLYVEDSVLFIKSIKLCDIYKIKQTTDVANFAINDSIKKQIEEYFIDLQYLKNSTKELGDVKNGIVR